jgi:DNA-binding NtrC family response regulator
MELYKILIIDDDKLLQESIKDVLADKYEVMIAGTGEEAIKLLKKNRADLALLDIRLPGIDGIETLRLIRKLDFDVVVIMMTAYEDVKSVITTMKMGAFHYLVKPLDIDELEVNIEKALENLKIKRELSEIRNQKARDFDIGNIIAQSVGMAAAMKIAKTVSESYDTTALLEGETGTGKEVIAKVIHYGSDRYEKPFVGINCSAISKDLLESELFGYEKGTFTGGLLNGKKGKCEMADSGTLFLDEISELLPSAQVKLLRFLEEREFYRVGGTEKIKVDVRVLAATNQSLEEAINRKTFREDLYYRLNVARIFLPPLRERSEDIIPLVMFFMKQLNEKFGKQFSSISPDAREIFLNYHWPGNVRELRNAIERVILVESDKQIKGEYLRFLKKAVPLVSPHRAEVNQVLDGGIHLSENIENLIMQALEKSAGNKTLAAKSLKITRSQLLYRLKKISNRSDKGDYQQK